MKLTLSNIKIHPDTPLDNFYVTEHLLSEFVKELESELNIILPSTDGIIKTLKYNSKICNEIRIEYISPSVETSLNGFILNDFWTYNIIIERFNMYYNNYVLSNNTAPRNADDRVFSITDLANMSINCVTPIDVITRHQRHVIMKLVKSLALVDNLTPFVHPIDSVYDTSYITRYDIRYKQYQISQVGHIISVKTLHSCSSIVFMFNSVNDASVWIGSLKK